MVKRIIIQEVNHPKNKNTKKEVKWICDSLGLIKGRDTEDVSFKIIYQILNSFSDKDLVSTEEIANSLKLESPRVNHHIRMLMGSGIIFREKRKIALRGGSLTNAIQEMQRDSERFFQRILEISKKLDKKFEL